MGKFVWIGVLLAGAACGFAADVETVGRHGNGRVVLPVNQVITPAGKQVELPGMRAQAMRFRPMPGCWSSRA